MLEWGSISKTVTSRITEQLAHADTLDLSAAVSEYLSNGIITTVRPWQKRVPRTLSTQRRTSTRRCCRPARSNTAAPWERSAQRLLSEQH